MAEKFFLMTGPSDQNVAVHHISLQCQSDQHSYVLIAQLNNSWALHLPNETAKNSQDSCKMRSIIRKD